MSLTMAGWNEDEVLFSFERCRNVVCNVIDTLMSNESGENLDLCINAVESVYTNIWRQI